MTGFGNVFSVTLKEKFRNMNFVLMIDLIAIAVTIFFNIVQGTPPKESYLSTVFLYSLVVYFGVFIRLSVVQEKTFRSDSYRLIPISNTSLYLSNMASSFVSFLYVVVVQLVLYAISLVINIREFMDFLNISSLMNGRLTFSAPNAVLGGVTFVGQMLGLVILGWTTITLIHLATSSARNFLPSRGHKFLSMLLYIFVIWFVLLVSGRFMDSMSNAINSFFDTSYISGFLFNLLVYLIVAGVESVISIFLMSRWVETITD
ncbi:hypothetical protein [Companilactobacillus hulinensis]|uniref:hypothetical protein n=1 Tax=Companilactobacillus hulinensis TaxID=2486007 RepID=UPI000F798537|nr:hypothetical protein [Companilactobacillus hulinensis]